MSYIANTPEQQAEMLKVCGVSSIDELFVDIPDSLKPKSFALPEAMSELAVHRHMLDLAEQNCARQINFVGGGFYDHFIPAAVDALISRSEFYTAYTPYQPELSQGTLQAMYEYQSDICRLTDMEASNASMYDGGTAIYEACQMAIRATRRGRIVVDGGINPVYRTMLYSYYDVNPDVSFDEIPVHHGQTDRKQLFAALDDNTAAVVLQNPNFFSAIDDHSDIVEHCHERGILVIQAVYPVAMTLLKTPGEIGADIAVGEGQSLGIPLSFGGPYLGFLATGKKLMRKMPGRIVGRTVDRNGKDCFVLTLQAREQHIRREKATSNICTNQALCAMRAHIYLSLVGQEGLKDIASLCVAKKEYAKERLGAVTGVEVVDKSPTFNEFVVKLPKDAGEVVGAMVRSGLTPGIPLGRFYPGMENFLMVALTEKRTREEIDALAEGLAKAV